MEERRFGPIRFIPGENRGRYPFCNSVYIEGAGVLIDPASDRDRLKQIRDEDGVDMVWLSHWHEDHFMHLDLFDDRPMWIGAPDHEPLADMESFLDGYGVEGREHRDLFDEWIRHQFHFKPRVPARLLRDGETIELGPVTVKVIGTPGHTPGHLAFVFREAEVCFVGDYDLTLFGPWYGDRRSSIEETVTSIRKLKSIPVKTYLAAHEEGVFHHPADAVWDRYEKVIYERERKLLELLQAPRTLDEIVESWIIYGKPREPKMFFEFGERSHMQKHLEQLEQRGAIARTGSRFLRK